MEDIKMKQIAVFCISFLFSAACLLAQTPEEIVSRMDEAMAPSETEGLSMVMDIKIPIVGTTSSIVMFKGEKSKMEISLLGEKSITWTDGDVEWTYDTKKKEVAITETPSGGKSEAEENASMFDDVTTGYDLTLKSETPTEWHIHCKKSRTNHDKDAPKTIDLVVSKASYLPVSLSTKISGISLVMRDVKIGVSDDDVTFHPGDYPDARIVDKRQAGK